MTKIEKIEKLTSQLAKRFASISAVNKDLNRTLVSFQANKKEPSFRWFKYKEGFSSALVRYSLSKTGIKSGEILDPFAGVGTTLFVAAQQGIASCGIELLPIGCEVIRVRDFLSRNLNPNILSTLHKWAKDEPWNSENEGLPISQLRITAGAFPSKTELLIGKYLKKISRIRDENARDTLHFALLTILEKISYTRKDGQYLRWDYRSGRTQGKKQFDKGKIFEFDEAIKASLNDILQDLEFERVQPSFFDTERGLVQPGPMRMIQGTVLEALPKLEKNHFSGIMTSPPYCNRYDYTRSYALELALLGVDEIGLKHLRQTMLSCTVENREKEKLNAFISPHIFEKANAAFASQQLLQEILSYLFEQKAEGLLNNSGIPRMVKNYFLELCFVIFESARVLKKGAPFIMVNDNVRYAGVDIPVDLILSDFAESAGLKVEAIWVLPIGKGNSSQQMGKHGRTELRKCVYIWRKL